MNTTMMMIALEKFAASDLRAAKKYGEILIGGTKRGSLTLRYVAGTYTLLTWGLVPEIVASGKPATVRPVLATLYVCAVES